ncbi:MAG TPA: DUF2892 domain-containing protein [Gammaproteobacteria bacterium]|nr:DUF2892 domain-containing protein [Gammaproteobacteria bacterium]
MQRNIGTFDMILRLGISVIMLYLGFIDRGIIDDALSSNIIGALGVLNLVVALIRHCPLYSLAGINTCKVD